MSAPAAVWAARHRRTRLRPPGRRTGPFTAAGARGVVVVSPRADPVAAAVVRAAYAPARAVAAVLDALCAA